MLQGRRRRGEVLEHVLGEHLAELDAPLVEAEDVPDDALDEYLVLVEGDERAEGLGRQLVGEQGIHYYSIVGLKFQWRPQKPMSHK